MKYHKPGLHFISASMADAVCVSGSNATPIGECTLGSDVNIKACKSGIIASKECKTGTYNTRKCKNGIFQGQSCGSGGQAFF